MIDSQSHVHAHEMAPFVTPDTHEQVLQKQQHYHQQQLLLSPKGVASTRPNINQAWSPERRQQPNSVHERPPLPSPEAFVDLGRTGAGAAAGEFGTSDGARQWEWDPYDCKSPPVHPLANTREFYRCFPARRLQSAGSRRRRSLPSGANQGARSPSATPSTASRTCQGIHSVSPPSRHRDQRAASAPAPRVEWGGDGNNDNGSGEIATRERARASSAYQQRQQQRRAVHDAVGTDYVPFDHDHGGAIYRVHDADADANPTAAAMWQTVDAAASFDPGASNCNASGPSHGAPLSLSLPPTQPLFHGANTGGDRRNNSVARSGREGDNNDDETGRDWHDDASPAASMRAAERHDAISTEREDGSKDCYSRQTSVHASIHTATSTIVPTADKPSMPVPRNQRSSRAGLRTTPVVAATTSSTATPQPSAPAPNANVCDQRQCRHHRSSSARASDRRRDGKTGPSTANPAKNGSTPRGATTPSTILMSSAESWVEGGIFEGGRRKMTNEAVTRTRETATARRHRGIHEPRHANRDGGGGGVDGGAGSSSSFVPGCGPAASADRHKFLHASCTSADRQFLRRMYART